MSEISSTSTSQSLDPRRWRALVVIAIAQLMVVLDASIVNIALPHLQQDLGITPENRQWVVTAYTLAFGGLLLLGGRVADFAGRKKAFMIGLIGFAGASALGGLANSQAMLFSARALQGVFAALLAPAALSLISVTFTDSKERAKAFAVYGGLSAGGAAIGLIMGGLLTEYASWRWCLGVNVPIAVLAVFLAITNVHESRAEGDTRYDLPGALTATVGLVSLVYGITKVGSNGWADRQTETFFGIAIVMLTAFILIEKRASHPLLPLRILTERNRGASYLTSFIVGSGLFAMFLFLSLTFQIVFGYSPVRSGLAFLPFSLGVGMSAGMASKLLPRFGPRPVTFVGLLMASSGLFLLTRLTETSDYLTHILPSIMIMSLGMGLVFVPISATALFAVGNHDTGVASAVLNTSQQIGGALGTALLNTIATSATTAYMISNQIAPSATGQIPPSALMHGFAHAFLYSTLIVLTGAVVWVSMVNADRNTLAANDSPVAHVG